MASPDAPMQFDSMMGGGPVSPPPMMGGGSSGYGMNETLANLRLNPDSLHEKAERYLRGQEMYPTTTDTGEFAYRVVNIGKPKMNDEGIQAVMSWLNNYINPHTVQGNLTEQKWSDVVYWFNEDFAMYLWVNLEHWDVNEKDYQGIIDTFVGMFRIFITRPLENKERESYVPTMQHVERYTPEKQNSGGLFKSLVGGSGGVTNGN